MKSRYLLICLILSLSGCADTYHTFQNEVFLSELESINYEKAGYKKIEIGHYSFYMPERLENEKKLFTRINDKLKNEGFSNSLTIEYDEGPHFKDVPFFSFTDQPVIKKYESQVFDAPYFSPPEFCDQKIYISNNSYWFFCPRRDFVKYDYYLYEDGKYSLQLTLRTNSLGLTQIETRYILKSFTKMK